MKTKTLDELAQDILQFNHAHGWHQHPQDLAKSIVIEAAELLELFQWDVTLGRLDKNLQGKDLLEIKKEAADIFWYLLEFCHDSGFDLKEAVEIKYAHNTKKFPVEMFNGKDNVEFRQHQHRLYRQKRK
ncbi:nucleotide pyrophosphohydrolase [Patescibacteria group bacterium]|nr:nucleotide pyrophosphohydrolase [Patescibacteria group bacterium]